MGKEWSQSGFSRCQRLYEVVERLGDEGDGSPFLVGYLEIAAHRAILPSCEEGEATVGTRIEIGHLAPALPGKLIAAERG